MHITKYKTLYTYYKIQNIICILQNGKYYFVDHWLFVCSFAWWSLYSCLFIFILLCVLTFWVIDDVRNDFHIKTMFYSSLPPVVCRMVHVLFTFLCVFLCKVLPTVIVLCFCFVFLRVVHFVIVPSVFSNVYLI
jgi:hypothetical protein